MGLPQLTVRAALSTAPLAAASQQPAQGGLIHLFGPVSLPWTDLSGNKPLGLVTERGRGSELEEFQAGTATVALDNRDRSLDPANTAGPYYGNLKPRKRLSLQATWNAVTYDLFDGHVKAWPQEWEGLFGKCQVAATDAFEMFQGETFASTGTRVQERSEQRVGFILDQIGWPAGRRTLNTGLVDVQAHDYDAMNVLQNMREMEKAEGGFLFTDAAGNVVFQDKYKRLRDYTTSQATFSDAPTGAELPFVDFERQPGAVEFIVNHATGKLANQEAPTLYETSDATSRTDYGPAARTLETWAALGPEVEAQTMALVDRYKQPFERVKSITIEPQMDDLLWPQALGRVIGERITVKGNFFGKGSVLTQESRIEGIRHEYHAEPLRWTTTFRLSAVAAQELAGYWLLGTSVLGTDTVPVW